MFFQSLSRLFGGLFVHFEFDGVESIEARVMLKTFLFFTFASIIVTSLVLLLSTAERRDKIN